MRHVRQPRQCDHISFFFFFLFPSVLLGPWASDSLQVSYFKFSPPPTVSFIGDMVRSGTAQEDRCACIPFKDDYASS